MKVVDLFAGLGGFSAGALAAGAEVILGVDHDPVPLKLWSANVPGGRAVLTSLGSSSGDAVSLPPPSPHLHVHASTPCTDLSPARGRSATLADVASGVCMLRWALDLVLKRGDHSWSLENVSTPKTREVLADYAARFPKKVAFAMLGTQKLLEVFILRPGHRHRLLALTRRSTGTVRPFVFFQT